MILGGCVASHQSVVEDVNVMGWSESTVLTMQNVDTTTLRNIDIFARYAPLNVADSVQLIINTISPDSTSYSEEITLHFDSRPKERGASRLSRYPYRQRVVWREVGEYRMEITPSYSVNGVEAVGINIEKSTIGF